MDTAPASGVPRLFSASGRARPDLGQQLGGACGGLLSATAAAAAHAVGQDLPGVDAGGQCVAERNQHVDQGLVARPSALPNC